MSSTSSEHNHDHPVKYSSFVDGSAGAVCIWDGTSHYRYYAAGVPYRLFEIYNHENHRHSITLSINNVSGYTSSNLKYYTYKGLTKIDHTHQYECLGTVGSGTSISLTDNRPKYIKTYFIIKFR